MENYARFMMRIAAVVTAVAMSGCSLIGVTKLDDGWRPERQRAPVCDDDARPYTAIDLLVGLLGIGAVVAATDDASAGHRASGAIGIGVGTAVITTSVLSFVIGRRWAAECRAAQADYLNAISQP